MYVYLDLLSTTYDYIYSDSCTGQNRNKVMEMPLLHTVKTSSIEVIDHKFLQTGHTNMERLEFAKKNILRYTIPANGHLSGMQGGKIPIL